MTGSKMTGSNSYQNSNDPGSNEPAINVKPMQTLGECNLNGLLKEELRCKIQLRRLQEGKGELSVTFPVPEQHELTQEEKEKQERRKERNRQAAKKSRNKRKDQQRDLQDINQNLKSRNSCLKKDVEQLRELARTLQRSAVATRNCSILPAGNYCPPIPAQISPSIVSTPPTNQPNLLSDGFNMLFSSSFCSLPSERDNEFMFNTSSLLEDCGDEESMSSFSGKTESISDDHSGDVDLACSSSTSFSDADPSPDQDCHMQILSSQAELTKTINLQDLCEIRHNLGKIDTKHRRRPAPYPTVVTSYCPPDKFRSALDTQNTNTMVSACEELLFLERAHRRDVTIGC